MKYQGLVDPEDKPFGNALPFEVQLKIMFWVECFVTMDKQKTLLKEFKGLCVWDDYFVASTAKRVKYSIRYRLSKVKK